MTPRITRSQGVPITSSRRPVRGFSLWLIRGQGGNRAGALPQYFVPHLSANRDMEQQYKVSHRIPLSPESCRTGYPDTTCRPWPWQVLQVDCHITNCVLEIANQLVRSACSPDCRRLRLCLPKIRSENEHNVPYGQNDYIRGLLRIPQRLGHIVRIKSGSHTVMIIGVVIPGWADVTIIPIKLNPRTHCRQSPTKCS